jgi:hypothetical protein
MDPCFYITGDAGNAVGMQFDKIKHTTIASDSEYAQKYKE